MTLQRIPLDGIVPNPNQPRKRFDSKAHHELAASIRSEGLKQPITVRPLDGGRFMIAFGERRWRASSFNRDHYGGPAEITCHVVEMSDEEMAIGAILENLQREDVRPLEEARAFQDMLDRGMSAQELARRLGLGQAWRITYRTRLLRLDDSIQTLVEGGQITCNAAQEIAKLEKPDQLRVVRRIASGQLKTDTAVSAAVQAILDKLSQADIFGGTGQANDDEIATVNRMERKIEAVAGMVAAGWKDGECVVARKVSPDRTARMADQIGAIRKHLTTMEKQLRQAAAQAEIVFDDQAA